MRSVILTTAVAIVLAVPAAAETRGWRGDGTGHFPDAKPPLKWGRISKTLKEIRNSAEALPEGRLDKAKAIETLEAAIAKDPKLLEAHYNLAVIHLETRHVRDAIASLERTIKIDPKFEDGYRQLGRIYEYFMYDIDTAKTYYDLAERVARGQPATQPATKPGS